MNKNLRFILYLFILFVFSCESEIDYNNLTEEDIESEEFDPSQMDINSDEDVEIYHETTGEYPDGTYCGIVHYYNPNTGTSSKYNLNIEVEDGDMVKILWSNGGWLDNSHFSPKDISDGDCRFTSDKGYEYKVEIGDWGGCYSTDGYQLRNDIEDDEEKSTCPDCGDEKDEYDDLCSSCERKKEIKEEEEKVNQEQEEAARKTDEFKEE